MPLFMPLAMGRREKEAAFTGLAILVCCAAWTPLLYVLVFDLWGVFGTGVLLRLRNQAGDGGVGSGGRGCIAADCLGGYQDEQPQNVEPRFDDGGQRSGIGEQLGGFA